jgi:hypothetical protein
MSNKQVNNLLLGDVVLSITNQDGTTSTFKSPMTVVKTGAFVKLSAAHLNGRLAFWPTGKTDTRTCEVK